MDLWRKQIERHQNNMASVRYRLRRVNKARMQVEELESLLARSAGLKAEEITYIGKIQKMKQWLASKIKDKCSICNTVLPTVITPPTPHFPYM